MKYQLLNNFIQATNRAATLEMLDDSYVSALNHLGFEQFSHSYYNPSDPTGRYQHDVAAVSLLPWHKHFITQKYEEIDHIGAAVRAGILPVIWDLHKEYKDVKDKQKALVIDALDYKLHTGMSIPFHDANHEISLLVVHDKDIRQRLQREPFLLLILQQLGLYYHDRVTKLLHANDNNIKLTPRELECMRLTAQHKTAKEIARQLQLSPRTIGFHIENVINKLNVRNKYEAISKLASLIS